MNALEFRVMLVVADLPATLHFYETLLGLRRVMAWEAGKGPAGAILSLGPGRSLEVRGPKPGGAAGAGEGLASGNIMLGVAVADAQATHDALAAAGVAIARQLKDNPWGDRSFAVIDPNGVRVWVYQITDADLARDLALEGA